VLRHVRCSHDFRLRKIGWDLISANGDPYIPGTRP
jgi:hypothetical protein